MEKITKLGRCQRCGEEVNLDNCLETQSGYMIRVHKHDNGDEKSIRGYFLCYRCLKKISNEMKYNDQMFITIISTED